MNIELVNKIFFMNYFCKVSFASRWKSEINIRRKYTCQVADEWEHEDEKEEGNETDEEGEQKFEGGRYDVEEEGEHVVEGGKIAVS